MPRPKRPKLLHTATDALKKKKDFAPSTTPQRSHASSSSGRVTNGSDDSDGLVRARTVAKNDKAAKPAEYTMTGALAFEDTGGTRFKPPSGQTRATLSRIVRDADHAKAIQEKQASNQVVGATQKTAASGVSISMPQESAGIGRLSRGRVGLSAKHTAARPSMGSASLMQSSRLGGPALQRRSRQPSLLQMVDTQDDSTGSFDDEELHDFRPDDESTPLVKSSRQPNAHPTSTFPGHTSSSRKRKLGSAKIQVVPTQSQNVLLSSSPAHSQSSRAESNLTTPPDGNPVEPTLPRLLSSGTRQSEIFDDTLAPPQSSSPVRRTNKSPQGRNPASALAHSQQKVRSPIRVYSSPESPTLPNHIPLSPVKPLTTANLQNLLPRRRRRPKAKTAYDIPSSSEVELGDTGFGEDEDELSLHTAKRVRPKKSLPSMQKRGRKGHQAPDLDLRKSRPSKTYSRKRTGLSEADHEDDDDDDEQPENDVAAETRKPTELNIEAKAGMRRLVDKFKEVDEYTLDFEDMTGSSSQMKDAR